MKKKQGSCSAILLGARLALEDYPGVSLMKRLRNGEGFEYELARDISSFLIGCRKDDLILFENLNVEEIKPVAKQKLFECQTWNFKGSWQ